MRFTIWRINRWIRRAEREEKRLHAIQMRNDPVARREEQVRRKMKKMEGKV